MRETCIVFLTNESRIKLKVSSKCHYAVRALLDMAYHSPAEPLKIDTIAARAQIPPRFLEQIFQDLRRAGVVGSKRGPKGGYFLAIPTDRITISIVVSAIEGELRDTLCKEAPGDSDNPHCGQVAATVWTEILSLIHI